MRSQDFCDQAQIQLVLFQTSDGLSSELAFNGNPRIIGYWSIKSSDEGRTHIFRKGYC